MSDVLDDSRFRPRVSVIIKTYDDRENSKRGHDVKHPEGRLRAYLQQTLDALNNQTLSPHEVLIVDSSKGAGIINLLEQRPNSDHVPLQRIVLASEKFSHPRALNLGVREAKGEIVASLSGDASPANENWLACLVQPLGDPKVAGSYSRQIERPDHMLSFMERLRLWWRYRSRSRFIRKDPLFSNACSAFRRDLALDIPFDETLVEVEDYDWSIKVRHRGFKIVYAGDSEVYHSHYSSSWETLHRMVDYAYRRVKLLVVNRLRNYRIS
jgi:GT2 family glycosyltransferase